MVGFEIEFILLKSTLPDAEPIGSHDWSTTASIYTGSTGAIVLEEIADALQAGGVELQMYHAEAAPGQYEVVTGPLSPLQAADALVYSHEVIYNIANKHKLRATFAPKVFGNSCPSSPPTDYVIIADHGSQVEAGPIPISPSTLRPSKAKRRPKHQYSHHWSLSSSNLSSITCKQFALSPSQLPHRMEEWGTVCGVVGLT